MSFIGKYITETVMTGNMYKNIHSSLVYSIYKSEIIQTLINSKMDKQIVGIFKWKHIIAMKMSKLQLLTTKK